MFCTDRSRSPLNSLLFSSCKIVNSYFDSTVDDAQLRTPNFLSELIDIRDGQFEFLIALFCHILSCVTNLRILAHVNQHI